MIPGTTLLFMGLTGACLLAYLHRRNRRQSKRWTKLNIQDSEL